MSRQKNGRFTRNDSRGRSRQREPLTKDSNALQKDLTAPACLSHEHEQQQTPPLPPNDDNKAETVVNMPLDVQVSNNELSLQANEKGATSGNPSSIQENNISIVNNAEGEDLIPKQFVTLAMGDNKGSETSTLEKPQDAKDYAETLRLVLEELRDIKTQMLELKEIKSQMSKLDKIETSRTSLASDVAGVIGRTEELETNVTSNAARLRELDDEVSTIKNAILRQDKSLSKVTAWKEEVIKSNSKSISRMNELVKTQQKQVDLFHENREKIPYPLQT